MKTPFLSLACLVALFCAFNFESWAQQPVPAQRSPQPHSVLGYTDSYAQLQPPGLRSHRLSSADRHDTGNEDGFMDLQGNPTAGSVYIDAAKNHVVLGEIKTGPQGGVRLPYLFKTFMELISKNQNATLPDYNLIIEDGDTVLSSLPILKYFDDTTAPHLFPLVYGEIPTKWGFNNFYPFEAKDMRVAVDYLIPEGEEMVVNQGSKQFFGLRLTSWADQKGNDYLATLNDLERTVNKSLRGSWPHKTEPRWKKFSARVQPGASTQLVNYTKRGAVLGLRVKVLDLQDLTDLWICIEADGKQRAKLPLSFMFGMGRDPYDTRAAFFGLSTTTQTGWNYFPQPFKRGYKIFIENRSADPNPKFVQVDVSRHHFKYPEPWGYFTAIFNETASVPGQYYHKADITGYGKVVAETMTADAPSFFDVFGTLIDGPFENEFHLEGDVVEASDDEDCTAGDGTETEYGMAFYHLGEDMPQIIPPTPEFPALFPQGRYSNPFLGHSGSMIFFTAGTFNDGENEIQGAHVSKRRSYYLCRLNWEKYFYNSYKAKAEHGPHNITDGILYQTAVFLYHNETPVMTLADEINLTDLDSENAHSYVVDEDFQNVSLTTRYWYKNEVIADQGYAIPLGEQSSFTITVPADNKGIRLSARTDGQTPAPVTAKVFVDGVEAGIFHRSETSDGGCFEDFGTLNEEIPRWKTMAVEIPAQYTQGKTNLQITVVPQTEGWNEYRWQVFSYK